MEKNIFTPDCVRVDEEYGTVKPAYEAGRKTLEVQYVTEYFYKNGAYKRWEEHSYSYSEKAAKLNIRGWRKNRPDDEFRLVRRTIVREVLDY